MTSQTKLRMIINGHNKDFDNGDLTDLAGALETIFDYLQFTYPLDFPGMENNYGLGADE